MQKKNKHYLSNKDLYIEMIISKAQGRLTKRAENMIILLAKNIHRKFYYVNKQDAEDCLQTAIMHALLYWRSFDENKTTNAFAYFSEILKRGHARSWNDLEKYREEVSLNQFFGTDGDLNL